MRRPYHAMIASAVGLLVLVGRPAGFVGNDTGGIIPWSPETRRFARDIAAEHCAAYRKFARITSVHARYGDYIGFECVWSRSARP
jgi:hypothetical protein